MLLLPVCAQDAIKAGLRCQILPRIGQSGNDLAGRQARELIAIADSKMTSSGSTEAQTLGLSIEGVLLVLAVLPRLSFRKMTVKGVDFTEADLKACDFRDTVFEDCSLRDSHLPECRFEGADLRNADIGGIKLTDARLFRGALISKRQAADLLGQLGLKVL
jgi:uncharacterized protein YjbI with pentapeptide repeats